MPTLNELQVQYDKEKTLAELRGELLEVIAAWADDHECGEYGVDETDRLRLVDMLTEYLKSLERR